MYFQLISQIFYSNFEWEYSLDEKFNSSSKEYPCCIILMDPATQKWEIHEKCDCNHIFSCIFHFSCSRVHQKYETWVLLRWGIKFCIQRVLPLKIWVKNLGDKLKIPVEKVILLFYYFLVILPFYLKNGESSPMVEIINLNPMNSFKLDRKSVV